MMHAKPLESDWKLFRQIVPELRERYLKERNQRLIAMLSDAGKSPTDQFWDTLKEMESEAKTLCRCLDGHSRSKMVTSMGLMCRAGMLSRRDLEAFSEGLRAQLDGSFAH